MSGERGSGRTQRMLEEAARSKAATVFVFGHSHPFLAAMRRRMGEILERDGLGPKVCSSGFADANGRRFLFYVADRRWETSWNDERLRGMDDVDVFEDHHVQERRWQG